MRLSLVEPDRPNLDNPLAVYQISDGLCAALYDEEKCSRSADFLELRPGDQGVLPLLTTGLRRNDVESLIVSYRQTSALSLVGVNRETVL